MRIIGQISLLLAFVCSGYAAFACVAGGLRGRRGLIRLGLLTGGVSVVALVLSTVILAHALVVKDFSFVYVAQYSSNRLPWHYSLSALWVGQAGSLLLWSGLQGLLAFMFWWGTRRSDDATRATAFGIVIAFVCFLIGVMVFGADPMELNRDVTGDGAGLSPLLQHPAMLIHPPIVFLGYALWTIPAAVAASALLHHSRRQIGPSGAAVRSVLGAEWIPVARPWALLGWIVLGTGILLGAEWSYEELGWGGYWAWDPVENGSLLPWLTGTALIHGLMAWRFRGVLKKITLGLAIATFGLCNFATFLTRSGIFSSLHAFSESPIGWLFLALMIVCVIGSGVLFARNWRALQPESAIDAFWSRESQIVISTWVLLLLAGAVFLGTLSVAVSEILVGHRVVVGMAFYNNVMIPVALTLIVSLALAPLLRWGRNPSPKQVHLLQVGGAFACFVAGSTWLLGVSHPLALLVAGAAGLAIFSPVAALWMDKRRIAGRGSLIPVFMVLRIKRRQYAGFLVHLGFVCLVIGVTGSSLGSHREEFVLHPGDSIDWSGRSVRFVQLHESDRPDKFIVEAELEVTPHGEPPFAVRPAQHLHRLQGEWTTEVGIHATWAGDFYAILHNGEPDAGVRITLVENPLMRWLWLGGGVMGLGTITALWPARSLHSREQLRRDIVAAPKFMTQQEQGTSLKPPGERAA